MEEKTEALRRAARHINRFVIEWQLHNSEDPPAERVTAIREYYLGNAKGGGAGETKLSAS